MPSSPGTSTDCFCGRAQVKRDGAASAAAEICFRKLRLEFMVVPQGLKPNPNGCIQRRPRRPALSACFSPEILSYSKVTPRARKKESSPNRAGGVSEGKAPSEKLRDRYDFIR